MNTFLFYFLLFFIYSVLGWIIEIIVCSHLQGKKVLNRGFLIGPYVPIYGTAAMLMILFLNEYKNDIFVLFCMSVVYASLLEYFTSYIMEKIFKARWWDYNDEKFNINGRICLKNCLLFGLLGLIVIHFINPAITFLLNMVPSFILNIVSLILLCIFVLDIIVTIYILSKLNIQIKNIEKDATEEIDKQVKKMLKHYKFAYKRLFKSFPSLRFTTKKGNLLIDKIRKRFDEVDDFLTKKKTKIAKIRQKIKELKKEKSLEEVRKEKEKLKSVRRDKLN